MQIFELFITLKYSDQIIDYNYLFMNPVYFFNPYWHFISPSNIFPFLETSSYENYHLTNPIIFTKRSMELDVFPQKKITEMSRESIHPEKIASQKRKIIKKTQQDKNFLYRYQDKERNIYSNILKSLVVKIREDPNFQSQCQLLMNLLKFELDFDQLTDFIDSNFQRSKTYISPGSMKKVLDNSFRTDAGKFFRILLSKYLKEDFILILLASQRIRKQSKILQMKKARQLYTIVFGVNQQNEDENFNESC